MARGVCRTDTVQDHYRRGFGFAVFDFGRCAGLENVSTGAVVFGISASRVCLDVRAVLS